MIKGMEKVWENLKKKQIRKLVFMTCENDK